ncbi:MAG: cytochrome c oxidase accessory protein CcoG [Hyphomonadaceae bacterium]|jgi:cytochrome c oxidase accessory protein FixG|nr:cytochrome c oxidase accessory protein CcoG [Hyphomonadaceae bacterium]
MADMATLIDKKSAPSQPVEAFDGIARANVDAVNAAKSRELYEKRQQIYPKTVKGTWRTIKWVSMIVFLAIYYAVPFLRWDRPGAAPDQMVLVDFPGLRVYLGPVDLWPQDFYIVSGILILSAVALFLASALFGRVWCGFACPQTVWTDLYIAVETAIEGDRNQRIRLDRAPMSFEKAWKKGLKHAIWLVIALATGGWFVAYFHDAPTLFKGFFTGQAPLSAYGFAGLLTFTTYALAGTMREQVCTYMCPWPRIQGAMLDNESLSVTYLYDRGDPRGPHKKNETWDGRGDCIDCKQCVAACPAGIDIRDGLQIECINCALCIDACDEIMDKVGRPRGLIAYDSEKNMERRAAGQKNQWNFIRGRTVFYAGLLVAISAVLLGSLLLRTTMTVNVIRDRAPLFVQLSDGKVRNAYTIKVVNKTELDQTYSAQFEGLNGAMLSNLDGPVPNGVLTLKAPAGGTSSARVFLVADPARVTGNSVDLTLVVESQVDGKSARSRSMFFARN